MNHLQIWLQNHNRRLTQEAIDEALMEYIASVEKQRDDLLAALERIRKQQETIGGNGNSAWTTADFAIAIVKGETK